MHEKTKVWLILDENSLQEVYSNNENMEIIKLDLAEIKHKERFKFRKFVDTNKRIIKFFGD